MNKKIIILYIIFGFFLIPMRMSAIDVFDAIKNGGTNTIRMYIKNKENLNARDDAGNTPLIYAADNGNSVAVRLLINAMKKIKIDLNGKNNNGRTALMNAAEIGNSESLNLLIDAKADMNQKDAAGNTALIIATKKGKIEIVKILISAGADLNIKNNDGHTALTESGLWPDIMSLLASFGAK